MQINKKLIIILTVILVVLLILTIYLLFIEPIKINIQQMTNKTFRKKETFIITQTINNVKSIKIFNNAEAVNLFGIFIYDANGNAIDLTNTDIGMPTQSSTYSTKPTSVLNNVSGSFSGNNYGPSNALKIINSSELNNTNRTLTQALANNNTYYYGFNNLNKPPGYMDWTDNNAFCSRTLENGFWKFDFNNPVSISGIEIFGRTDCCVSNISNLIINLIDYNNNIVKTFSFGPIKDSAGKLPNEQGYNSSSVPQNIDDAHKVFTINIPTTTQVQPTTTGNFNCSFYTSDNCNLNSNCYYLGGNCLDSSKSGDISKASISCSYTPNDTNLSSFTLSCNNNNDKNYYLIQSIAYQGANSDTSNSSGNINYLFPSVGTTTLKSHTPFIYNGSSYNMPILSTNLDNVNTINITDINGNTVSSNLTKNYTISNGKVIYNTDTNTISSISAQGNAINNNLQKLNIQI